LNKIYSCSFSKSLFRRTRVYFIQWAAPFTLCFKQE